MKVVVAARNVNKAVLQGLAETHGATLIACDASEPTSVSAMFAEVANKLGTPRLVVHNIDG
jgi:NAD(P)-dependent dehydrogenase (short-subunit alcohol dehydrogenase family)